MNNVDRIIAQEEESTQITGAGSDEENELFKSEQKHIHWIFIGGLWVISVAAALIMLIRAAHFVIPDCWRWLDAENLQNIDKFLFSGLFGAFLALYAKYVTRQ